MKRFIAVLSGLLMAACVMGTPAFSADQTIAMSTTTSTQASGLLDVLLPEFTADTGIQVKVIAKGTGAAIRDGQDGNVDVIFVHAKAREEKFVSEGWGTKRYAVMHNDFVILGPSADPAGIKGETDVAKALKKIAESGSVFVSRGDDSGTHTKEQELWKLTGLTLIERITSIASGGKTREIRFIQPDGKWYMSIGQGMGKTLTFADEKRAYALADRGTYIKYKLGRKEGLDLEVLSEGDASLQNLYGVIPVNPAKYPHVKYEAAEKFAQWLVSPKGQKLIADYKLLGQQLFYPDAISK
ncbi:MAG: substrate-binding domain-containing protein [Desulfobacterales bacterium]|nr:substrate-binding domain-containing protein [Desulfobacterales bacterium]MDD4392119.1 substrate-binding domain-containing protein [Desulfobacterales bacterium]